MMVINTWMNANTELELHSLCISVVSSSDRIRLKLLESEQMD